MKYFTVKVLFICFALLTAHSVDKQSVLWEIVRYSIKLQHCNLWERKLILEMVKHLMHQPLFEFSAKMPLELCFFG